MGENQVHKTWIAVINVIDILEEPDTALGKGEVHTLLVLLRGLFMCIVN